MMCSRRSKSLDEEERGVGLGNCPWGTGGSCVSGGAVSGILESLTLVLGGPEVVRGVFHSSSSLTLPCRGAKRVEERSDFARYPRCRRRR